ncbi:HdeD family acid-resistance protein [Comamonas testosteroni]|uniref:HdeD family acid-resistance protein n=1 Tax=Comamonas testosteroni TaxID=285 RepID=A0A373FTJ2_COMTE|nr:HdeD family acid-resistance protein [Comamonas testosteroni]RGE46775.1 HdeD family acid-resistance protein [Comamonas testosteroni]
MAVDIPSMSVMLRRSWWVLLLRGVAAIVFGVLTWMQPAASAAALVLIFGAYVFLDGVLGVYSAIKSRNESRHWWMVLLWGLTGVVFGVLTVINPAITALVLTIYIGVWALITGVVEIVAALRLRKEIEGEWLLVLGGLISVLFGAFVLAQPGAGMMAMLWVIATYAVIFGVLMVLLAFKVKKAL